MTRACSSSTQVVLLALGGNILVAAVKSLAAALTGSSAMLSEAVHSVVDTANEGLLLYGSWRARRRPDLIHPLGYGRELYFWSFIVALLVFALGAGVSLYEGVQRVVSPRAIDHPAVNYIVLGISFVFEGISWLAALRRLRQTRGSLGYWEAIHRSKDPPAFMVLFEDSAALIGIVIAAGGLFLSHHFAEPVFDGAASVLIGLVLAAVATILARESKSLLIGERAAPALVAAAVKIAEDDPSVVSAHGAITVHLAPEQIVVALSIQFADRSTTHDIEASVERIEKRIQSAHPDIVTLFIKPQSPEEFERWRLVHFGSGFQGQPV